MKNIIKNMERGFTPLAILLVAGIFVATGFFVLTPQTDTFAAGVNPDPVNIVSDGAGNFDVYAVGDPALTEVHPLVGINCTKDVRNVQWALMEVAEGGTVTLKATETDFHFGEFLPPPDDVVYVETLGDLGGALIVKSCTVKGERVNGEIATKIIGGFYSFTISDQASVPFPDIFPGIIDVTVQDIWFDGTTGHVINVLACKSAVIQDNKITNYKLFRPLFNPLARMGAPILVMESELVPGSEIYGNLGNVKILRNEIDSFGSASDPTEPDVDILYSAAINVAMILDIYPWNELDTKVLIKDNILDNPGHEGVAVSGAPGAEEILITGNTVNQREYAFDDNQQPVGPYYGLYPSQNEMGLSAGIVILRLDLFGGPVLNAKVVGNTINNAAGNGIILDGAIDTLVADNTINMNGGDPSTYPHSAGIQVTNSFYPWLDLLPPEGPEGPMYNTVQGNTVSGSAEYGIYMQSSFAYLEVPGPALNTFEDNDLTALHASAAQVYLDGGSHYNTFNGNFFGGIVGQAEAGLMVEGMGNTFTGNSWSVNYPDWVDAAKGLWWMTGASEGNAVVDPIVTGNLKRDKHWKNDGSANTLNGLE